jgi:hypothetical protein
VHKLILRQLHIAVHTVHAAIHIAVLLFVLFVVVLMLFQLASPKYRPLSVALLIPSGNFSLTAVWLIRNAVVSVITIGHLPISVSIAVLRMRR